MSRLGVPFNPFSRRIQRLLEEAVESARRFRVIENHLMRVIRETFEGQTGGGLVQFPAILINSTPIATNRWEYQWAETRLDEDNNWVTFAGSRNSSQPGRAKARNWAEYLNSEEEADYGVELEDPPTTFTVKPIPFVQPVLLTEFPIPSDPQTLGYWFEAVNALDPECDAEPPP